MTKSNASKNASTFSWSLWLAVIIAASAGLLFGFDTGNIAGALAFIGKAFHTTTIQNEWIVSLTVLGAFFGAMFSGKGVDRYGRKKLLIAAALLYALGALLGTVAESITQLMIARFLLGLAIGISSYTAPLYISEISPAQFRGFFVLLNGVAITGGEALAYWLDYQLSFIQDWRDMFFLGFIPAIILGVGMFFMPCSPRWLVLKGKVAMAKAVLQKFYGAAQVDEQLQHIQILPSVKGTFLQLWRNPSYRRLLWIGIALGVFQQFFGINTVMYYGPFIFQQAGFHAISTGILLTFYMGVANTLMTVITGLTVDRFGRRTLLMSGATIAAVSLLRLAYLFHLHSTTAWSGTAMVMALIAYIIGYCISVGSLFWLIIAEIFPLSVRGQAMSIATAIQWLANFVVSVTFLSLLQNVGPAATFSLYAGICVLAILFTYRFIPETKQLSLETIEITHDQST